ncbi:MAG TPA: type II secretion system F family protein [Acidobacteriaceae bacterium]|nr:type II secretion system F family protein [Acidobacteriaceae bacterium]
MPIIFYVLLGLIVFGVVALMLMPNFFRPSPEAQRIMDVVKSDRPDLRPVQSKEQMQDKLLNVATNLRMRLGISDNPRLKERLAQAGIRGKSSMDAYFAAQYLVPIGGAALGTLFGSNLVLCVLAFGVAGYLAPDMWLNWMMGRRRKRIRRSIPDSLDLMVICVEAGLGLDQALLRIGQELAVSHPDIHDEFVQVNREQRAGRPRLEAWQNLAERTEIDEFRSFVGMLTQTDKFGTPIAKALTRFSEEIRTKRKQAAEEAAAKTKIKIIFPLVLCIFPCIFIVLLAPAVLNIMSGLQGMNQ